MSNIDPELMQDFLTESGELLDQLDQNLVVLEGQPTDPEILNQVFRALHTIKGSASFLALTNLVDVAHVAEGALNAARNRVVTLDRSAMDLLLAAVDTIKRQFVQLRGGLDLEQASSAVVAGLSRIADGKPSGAPESSGGGPSDAGEVPGAPAAAASDPSGEAQERPLALPPNKADLLDFLVSDLEQTLDQVEAQVGALRAASSRRPAAEVLAELAESLRKSVEFFEFDSMGRLARLIGMLAERAPRLPDGAVDGAVAEAAHVVDLLRAQSKGLARGAQVLLPLEAVVERFEGLLRDEEDGGSGTGPGSSTDDAVHGAAASPHAEETAANPVTVVKVSSEPVAASGGPAVAHGPEASRGEASQPGAGGSGGSAGAHGSGGEATIRVEVGRLETLLNLVGELVLQKNRMGALARQLTHSGWGSQEYREAVQQSAGGLDRVTSDLQTAVMRTRMQPLEKIFGKYPRLVRDLARKLNKQISLEIEGGQTEVDKSVIEELGDPLIHLMRNSADHGIESPEARRAAGKPESGTIRLCATNSGGHVEIRIIDDGKGLDPAMLARKAVEKGVIAAAEAEALTDRERLRLIFLPGFSTAEKVSDVSGRGVGMDVVRTNIEKIKGTIDLQSVPGRGTTVIISIPLTVAIMSAMMVGVGEEIYAVPLTNVIEIVKPTAEQRSTINQHAVMRLRDGVLPLLRGSDEFGVPGVGDQAGDLPFVVVLSHNEKRFGLEVSRLIGQQEIVIKPLDDCIDREGPVSGATVRDDGGVSLIVDVPRLTAIAEARQRAA